MDDDSQLTPDQVIARARERRFLNQRAPQERPIATALRLADDRERRAAARDFVHLCTLLARDTGEPEELMRWLRSTPRLAAVAAEKAAKPAALLAQLPTVAALASAWAESLRNVGLFDRLIAEGARLVPWHSRIGIVGAVAGDTPGEAAAKAVSALTLAPDAMAGHKATAIVVLSDELFKAPDFPADAVDAELVAAVTGSVDAPLVAALTSGVTPTASAGTPGADVLAALSAVPRGTMSRLLWVAGTTAADQIDALSPMETPRALANVFRSDQVTADSLMLLDASQVALADRGLEPSSARHASLELDDDPSGFAGSPPAPTNLVSLWQTGSRALRVERRVRYARLRADAVAVISGIAWSGGSP